MTLIKNNISFREEYNKLLFFSKNIVYFALQLRSLISNYLFTYKIHFCEIV